MNKFNVIIYDCNQKKFIPYDVLPYFRNHLKDDNPKTFDEYKSFVKRHGQWMFWSRCEWEIILSDWPPSGVSEKWDVYDQILMNIDHIVNLLMND